MAETKKKRRDPGDGSLSQRTSDGLWRGTIYGLEPPAIVLLAAGRGGPATANPFAAGGPPSTEFLAWSVVWVVIVLGLAVFSLSRRDL